MKLTVAQRLRLLADDADNMGDGVLDKAELRAWADELDLQREAVRAAFTILDVARPLVMNLERFKDISV